MQQSVIDNGGAYPWEFVCIVPGEVKDEEVQPIVEAGWKILRTEMPVQVDDIEGPLKLVIRDSGCCGASELIKLRVFSLTNYRRAIFFDADAIVLNRLDKLVNTD